MLELDKMTSKELKNMNTDKPKKSAKKELLVGTIVLCLAVILLTILFPKLYSNNFDGFKKITATVTAVNKSGNGEISETVFTYTYLNKEYNGSSTEIRKSHVGEKLEIYVDPELPTSVMIPNDLSRLLVILRLSAISIIAIAAFMGIANKSKEIFS